MGNAKKLMAAVAVGVAAVTASATSVGLLMGGPKAHNNEFDEQFEALDWDVARYECSVEGLDRFAAEAGGLDIVFAPPLFNWNGGDKWLLPEDGVNYAGVRRYIEEGGMVVVTEAQYAQAHGFFEKVDKSLAIRTGKCTSSPWQVLGYTKNEEPVHPLRCFPNTVSEADSWSHFEDPEKDGWTVLSRCSEGKPVVICRALGKGLVVYTALRQKRLDIIENYGAYNLLRKLGLSVTKFSAPPIDIGDGRIELELGTDAPAGASMTYEIRGASGSARFTTNIVGRAATLDFNVALRGDVTASLKLALGDRKATLFSRKGTVAPLFRMQPNWYRGLLSTKRRVKTVDFKAEFAPNRENLSGLPLMLAVYDSSSNKVAEVQHTIPTNGVPRELWLPVPLDQALGAGAYRLTGTITMPPDPPQRRKPYAVESSTTFEIIPPRIAQVIPDDDGTLLENGKPFFPLGIYHCNKAIDEIADLGFNAMQFWHWGLGAWFGSIPAGYYKAGSRSVRCLFEGLDQSNIDMLEVLRDGAATLGWYVADEPDENSVGRLVKNNTFWHGFDKHHPTYICSCRPDLFHIHQKYCDILSFDPGGKVYDTYHKAVVGWIKTAQKATQGGHKTIFVTPGCGNTRPSADFYRGVFYASVVHGVRGLMWYCWWQNGGGPLGVGLSSNQTPGVKEMFKTLNSEMKVISPGLLAVNRRMFEVGDVHGMVCGDGARNCNFLILVNITDQPQEIDITVPELAKYKNFKVKEPFSPENKPRLGKDGKESIDGWTGRVKVDEKVTSIKEGRVQYSFPAYGTLVYRW